MARPEFKAPPAGPVATPEQQQAGDSRGGTVRLRRVAGVYKQTNLTRAHDVLAAAGAFA
ncbi:hypothetical protein [Streptomyces althioticus]|uniref:hypothetical protein n=1 Tax=Streptomyces althioticus TaxID=83380 RepID=UPI0033F331B9